MSYHVSIINTSKNPNKDKILYSPDKVTQYLERFLLKPHLDKYGNIDFYYSENDDFALFYSNNSLWVSNPDERLIKLLISISQEFNDMSLVVGDEGEIYKSISEYYIYTEDSEIEPKKPIKDYILSFVWQKLWFFILIAFAVIRFLLE